MATLLTDITPDSLADLLAEGAGSKRGIPAQYAEPVISGEVPHALIECETEKEQTNLYQGFYNLVTKSKHKEKYANLEYIKVRTEKYPHAIVLKPKS